jgi:hypothetical protein
MTVVARGVSRCVRRQASACLVAALLIEAVPVGLARAEDDAAETAAARGLAVEGLKLADAGKCADAIDKLAKAEKLHHAPIVLGRLGECQISQGKLVDGTENLRKVLREPMPPSPSAALVKARERAQAALDGAKPKIALLTISVKGPPNNSAASVTVDSQSVSSALLDTERPSDPGEHVIEATAQGYLKASSRVTLGTGDKQAVTLKLEVDPNYVPPTTATETPNAGRTGGSLEVSTSTAGRDSGAGPGAPVGPPNRSGAYISWAFGGAALAVGAGFGLVAMKGKSDLDKTCPQNICAPSNDSKLSSAKTAGTVSTIAFGVGGAAVILGTVLFLTASPSSSERSAHATTAPRLVPRPWVGLNEVGVSGEF